MENPPHAVAQVFSATELSQYNTHLILALPSGEVLTSNYKNFYRQLCTRIDEYGGQEG